MKRESLITIFIGLLFIIIYACFPTKLHYIDGLSFSYDIENFPISYDFHQHHPLWLPMTYLLFHAFKIIIPGLRAIVFLSILNAILGGLSIILLIRLLNRLTDNWYASVLAGLFMGLCWGMMIDCTDANIYIFMLVMVLIIATILFSNERLTRKNSIIATLLTLFACLVHQMFFFYIFVVLTAIWICSPRFQRKNTLIICTGLYGLIIYIANYIIYQQSTSLAKGEIEIGFWQWLTAFGQHPAWWTAIKLGFWGALEVFNFQQMSLFIHTQGSELMHHADNYDAVYISTASILIHIIIIATIIWEIIRLYQDKEKKLKYRKVRILVLVWFLPLYIFNHLFSAFELHYKVLYLPPLIILWTLNLVDSPSKYHRSIVYAVSLLLVFMLTWNFLTGMLPNTNPNNNKYLVPVLDIAPLVKKGDLIILSDRQGYMSFLARIYTDADAITFKRGFTPFAKKNQNLLKIDRYTVEFLKNRYNRILLTDEAFKRLPEYLCFPERRLPPPHPWLLGMYLTSMEKTNEVKSQTGRVLHEMTLE